MPASPRLNLRHLGATLAYFAVIAAAFVNYLPSALATWQVVVLVAMLPAVVAGVVLRHRFPDLLGWVGVVTVIAGSIAVIPAGIFAAALRVRDWRLWALTGASAVGIAVALLRGRSPDEADAVAPLWSVAFSIGMYVLVPLLAGGLLRARRDLEAALRERAELAESERELRSEQAVQAERSRIAEEMHDSLGHTLVLLATQAGALEVSAGEPSVRQMAEQMRTTARAGLSELRAVVHALGEGETSRSPSNSGLKEVTDLVAASRASGAIVALEGDLAARGEAPPSPIGRAVHQTVQEGLTNAHRHAPGAPVRVRLTGAAGVGVRCTISNPLAPGGSAGSGTGLQRLNQRVAALGGTVQTRVAHGEFWLEVDLPWESVR